MQHSAPEDFATATMEKIMNLRATLRSRKGKAAPKPVGTCNDQHEQVLRQAQLAPALRRCSCNINLLGRTIDDEALSLGKTIDNNHARHMNVEGWQIDGVPYTMPDGAYVGRVTCL